MSKIYLRVTPSWQEILAPDTEGLSRYLANISGTSIQIQLSKIRNLNIGAVSTPTFTVGGAIGQLKIDPTYYVYARASRDTEGVAIVDTRHISKNDQRDLNEEIQAIGVQIARVMARVTNLELKDIDQNHKYYWFLRTFLKTTLKLQEYDAWLTERTLTLNKRLFAVENYIRDNKQQYAKIKTDVTNIFADIAKLGDITETAKTIANINAEVATIIQRLNTIEPQMEQYIGDVTSAVTTVIEPMTTKLEGVSSDLSALNNSIQTLTAKSTKAEITSATTELINRYQATDPTVVPTIRSLNTMLVSLVNKVDYEDTILVGGDLGVLETDE